MNMTQPQKFVRAFIICFLLFFMVYAAGTAIRGLVWPKDMPVAEAVVDPLDEAAAKHLELMKALRTENQEKSKKEAALKETTDNIELLKQKEVETKKAMDIAVTAPAPSPKE